MTQWPRLFAACVDAANNHYSNPRITDTVSQFWASRHRELPPCQSNPSGVAHSRLPLWSMEDRRCDLQHEPEVYPPFDGWYHPSPTDLIRLRFLMNREEQQNRYSRNSHWWVQIGDEPYPPLQVQQVQPAPQPSSLLPAHNVIVMEWH